jgi:hypothetical protein
MAVGMLFLASCNKENIVDNTENEDNQSQIRTLARLEGDFEFERKDDRFADIFNTNRAENTERFVVDANRRISIVTFDGAQIDIPANAFIYESREVVEGEVTIFFNLITDRGEMIVQDRATSALSRDGERIEAIESGAEVFINVEKDGEVVFLQKPMDIKIPTDEPLEEMQVFVEAEGTGDDLVWVVDEERRVVVGEKEGEGGRGDYVYGYQILPDLGDQWAGCNIDRFVDWTCPDRTTVNVEIPTGYDPTNTEVYMIPVGGMNMVANFDLWDAATNSFSEHGGQICVGQDVHFVLVTNYGGGLQYEIHTTTISPGGHVEVFTAPFASISATESRTQ